MKQGKKSLKETSWGKQIEDQIDINFTEKLKSLNLEDKQVHFWWSIPEELFVILADDYDGIRLGETIFMRECCNSEPFYCWTHRLWVQGKQNQALEQYLSLNTPDKAKLFTLVDDQGVVTISSRQEEEELSIDDFDIEGVN